MPVSKRTLTRASLAAACLLFLSACSSNKVIPMVIQSDPLGADVVYQVRSTKTNTTGDWIYLGKTPLEVNRKHAKDKLDDSHAFVFRVFKDGYLEQTKEWRGSDLEEEEDDKGHMFWNPRLVPSE